MPWSINNKLNPWYKQRDLPSPPEQSFRDWYIKNKKA
jgi:L-lactate dehydrogenase complex protein LldF